jgi:site-specific DNA-methyltransferase (adenine-specific)
MITITNEDCMALMGRYTDGAFDLAIVDPPYGIGPTWTKNRSRAMFRKTSYRNETLMPPVYFTELKRVSKAQIIFGYNYYTDIIGPTNHLLVWDKQVASWGKGHLYYSQAEIAYVSLPIPLQVLRSVWIGGSMGKETHQRKIHPHQKPVDLYKQILEKYAKPGWSILDTHLGSGSIAIACHDMGHDLTASEIDGDYYAAAKQRIERYRAQPDIFVIGDCYKEQELFKEGA